MEAIGHPAFYMLSSRRFTCDQRIDWFLQLKVTLYINKVNKHGIDCKLPATCHIAKATQSEQSTKPTIRQPDFPCTTRSAFLSLIRRAGPSEL